MFQRSLLPFAASLALMATTGTIASAQAAPLPVSTGWRVDGTGSAPSASPPATWAPNLNILWATPTSARGNASPVVVDDRIFITAEPTTLVCLNRADGKVLWQKTNTYDDALPPDADRQAIARQAAEAKTLAAELKTLDDQAKLANKQLAASPKDPALTARRDELKKQAEALRARINEVDVFALPKAHETNGYASSTPASNGQVVAVVFGTGTVAVYDLDGQRRWIRTIDKPLHNWGHSASPVIVGDRLIVSINDLRGLDLATGAEVWRINSKPRWGSPVVTRLGDTPIVITPNGQFVRPADGHVLADLSKDVGLEYNAPVVHDGVVYFIQDTAAAYRLPPAIENNRIQPVELWRASIKKDRYYGSPVIHQGLVYAITRKAQFTVLDAANGQVVYTSELALGDTCYPSPTLAGDRLFISGDKGDTLVLKPGREYVELARNSLAPFRSSPVFLGDRLYLRALDKLCCIGPAGTNAPDQPSR